MLLCDGTSAVVVRTVEDRSSWITNLAWSPDGTLLASGSLDRSLRVWASTGQPIGVLEGHSDAIAALSFSPDGRLLATASYGADTTVRLWRVDDLTQVAGFRAELRGNYGGVAFHPKLPILAVRGDRGTSTRIWELDIDALLSTPPKRPSVRYTNAKVVLVGEQGTGKSCLARALMGEPFEAQESTHGMKVWNYRTDTHRDVAGETTRETLLWDLAGQTDYQVVHQLFLDDTALGLVVLDATHPENPFGGVGRWEKALKKVAGNRPKVLVAGRADRGHPTVHHDGIQAFCREHGFAQFVLTSAKTGQGIDELRAAIAAAVPWAELPVTSSPELWKRMREFLLARRSGRQLLTARADLLEAFRREQPDAEFADAEFDTVIGHAQSQGLIWRLSFGDMVLLRPELLNAYASAVVRSARAHDQGLGCVQEQDVLKAAINFEDLERLPDPAAERTLLHAVVELSLAREVALREGDHLVFPSKFNRERPRYPQPPPREVAYAFTGPVEDIYATLVVRLCYCGAFDVQQIWKNAAEFRTTGGEVCSLVMDAEEGEATLSIFFGPKTTLENKALFLRFVHEHLQRRAAGSVKRERIYRCPACSWEVPDRALVQRKLARGDKTLRCLDCEAQILLFDLLEERFGDPDLLSKVRQMDAEADERKGREVGVATARGKTEVGEFDVFLAHNNADKPAVEAIAEELRRRGLNPWLDKEQVPPGRWWQDVLQQAIGTIKSAAIFVGPQGLGRWQAVELRTFTSQCVEKGLPVIPILLPGVSAIPASLPFLHELHRVQFHRQLDEVGALDDLQWGITGTRPTRGPGRL